MTEVEKLYKLAGVEKERHCTKDGFCSFQECSKCDYYNYIYPPFTAEKQLELIKWLAPRFLEVSKYYNNATDKYMFGIRTDLDAYACSHQENFEDMLAGLVINLWQDLTSDEQKQIREILK